MNNALARPALIAITLGLFLTTGRGQDSVKVFVEEVRIPVTAKDASGRFDPTVGINDPLVKENGIAQRGYVIKSASRPGG